MKLKSKPKKKPTLKPLPKLIKEAERVFNKWIRTRDQGKNCITCNKPGDQAGHYWPVRYSGVRFNEMNVHIQETACNKFKHGNVGLYRLKLVEMYGEEAVKRLDEEAIRTQYKKWDRTELQNIIEHYKI